MTMWVLESIDPTNFNTASDIAAQVATGILVLALSVAYPCLVWQSVKAGRDLSIHNLILPPTSLFVAFFRIFRDGGAWVYVVTIVVTLLVGTFSHAAADLFLKFVTVPVDTVDKYFLSPSVGSLPSYALLNDQSVEVYSVPGLPVRRLQNRLDYVAQGLGRFSIVSPDVNETLLGTEEGIIENQELRFERSIWQAREISAHNLEVECQSPQGSNIVQEFVLPKYNSSLGSVQTGLDVPDCDYESEVAAIRLNDPALDGAVSSWKVLSWMRLFSDHSSGFTHFGTRNSKGDYYPFWVVSQQETELAVSHQDWTHGRRIRDGLTLVLGTYNETGEFEWEPADGSVEIPMQESLLSGRQLFEVNEEDQSYYVLSSWSYHCPQITGTASGATLLTQNYQNESLDESGPSGCLIDTRINCFDVPFPQDINTPSDSEGPFICEIDSISVTTLQGVVVDPEMLAAYSGLATRNGGLNTDSPTIDHVTAINSIPAAYLATRSIVLGTAAVDGVRASIGPGYIFFMILPLFLALPLFAVRLRLPHPPVPKSTWDMMVLGHEEETVPNRSDAEAPFPPCPKKAKFGIAQDGEGTRISTVAWSVNAQNTGESMFPWAKPSKK